MEIIAGIYRSTVLVNEAILNPANSKQLLAGGTAQKQEGLQRFGQEIENFNAVQTESLLKTVLNGLAANEKGWDQNAREAALEILPIVGLRKIVPESKIFDLYSSAVERMLNLDIQELDPYGQFDAMLRAGVVLAPHIASSGYEKSEIDNLLKELKDRSKLYSTLKSSSNFSEEDTKYLLDQINALEEKIYSYGIKQESGNDEDGLGSQNSERFAQQVKALQDSGLTLTEIADQLGVSIQDIIGAKQTTGDLELSLVQIPGSNMPNLKIGDSPDSIADTIHEAKTESKDGYLTPEQQEELNRIQEKSSKLVMQYLDQMQSGDLFPLVAMSTGIGKGRIIHLLMEEQIKRKPDSKVLLIAGTKNVLVRQSHEKLAEYQKLGQPQEDIDGYIEAEEDDEILEETTGIEENPLEGQVSSAYTTGKIGEPNANIHIATIQTVHSRIKTNRLNPDNYDLVVVDEVHNIGTPLRKSAIDKFKKVAGFTATPTRNSGVLISPEEYGFTIVDSLSLPDAQNKHFLPPLVGVQINTKNLISEIPIGRKGTINYKKLEALLRQSPDLLPYIADRIERLIISPEGRTYKTIIAVNFVWEAQELAKLLDKAGFKAGVAVNQQAAKSIHTEDIPAIDSIERYQLEDNHPKSIQILISPYVAAEGFDAPFTEVLVWASPTDSGLRYTQVTGRVTRRFPGKPFGLVIDCLYQTSQHTWSYNMGRWLKGHVAELENGLLYLGPQDQMDSIKGLKPIQAVEQQLTEQDRIPLASIQEGYLEDIKETDFAITQFGLNNTFRGGERRNKPFANQVLQELREDENTQGLVTERKIHTTTVTVVTNRGLFIQKMLEKGARLIPENMLDVKETDAPITTSWIKNTFSNGQSQRVMSLANQVLRELREDESTKNLITEKLSGDRRIVFIVADKKLFIKMMLEKGARLIPENMLAVKETDASITSYWMRNTFSNGESQRVMSLANQVLRELREDEDTRGLIAQRKSRSHTVTVVTDKERFIQEMVKRGVKLKPPK